MRDRPAIIAPPPLLVALCLIAAAIANHFLPLPFFPGPPSIRIAVAVIVFLLAIVVAVLAQRQLFANKEHPSPYRPTNAIVSSGIYGRTRNPIYVGFMVVVIAVALTANDGWMLIALPALFVLLHFGVIRAEERYLGGKFGAEYEDYRRRVRRWI